MSTQPQFEDRDPRTGARPADAVWAEQVDGFRVAVSKAVADAAAGQAAAQALLVYTGADGVDATAPGPPG